MNDQSLNNIEHTFFILLIINITESVWRVGYALIDKGWKIWSEEGSSY